MMGGSFSRRHFVEVQQEQTRLMGWGRQSFSCAILKHESFSMITKSIFFLRWWVSCLWRCCPVWANGSYKAQLIDSSCQSMVPRWFSDMNHNKDKTNISHTSHVSLWGFCACLHEEFTPASLPSELKMKQAFLVCSLLQNPSSYGSRFVTCASE